MRLVLFFVFLGMAVFSAGASFALSSGFTTDRPTGCTPMVATFTPVDPVCAGCTYSWNFGTGSPVTGYSASSSFLIVGTHVVTLTVTDGTTTSSSTLTVTVYPNPVVSFTTADTAFCPGSGTSFTNTSINGVPGAATRVWNFGDAAMDTGNVTGHSYTFPGYYNVTLTVTNAQGCTSMLSKNAHIHVYNEPQAGFTQSRYSVCNPPGSVSFTNTTTGTLPISYKWDFSDGGISTGVNPVYTYTTSGTFPTKLVATDVNGCKDSVTASTPVYVVSISASFAAPDTVCLYTPVTFTNTSSTHTFRDWNFGDGASATTFHGTHTYTTVGNYTVRLAVSNSPCADTVTHVIYVSGGPPGGYIQSPAEPCPAPVNIQYTSTAPPGTIVEWEFEKQGIILTGTPKIHFYEVDSVVFITMIKTSPTTGCKDTLYTTDTLYNLAFLTMADTSRGCAPYSVDLSFVSITTQPPGVIQPYPFGFSSIIWDYGDGTGGGSGTPVTHTYIDTGEYKASIRVETNNGCVIIDTIKIVAGMAPAATFTASPLHVCRVDTVTFLANVTSVIPVDSFVWDFGDFLTFSDSAEIRRPFTLPGLFTVTLTPCNNGCCGDTFIVRDYVLVDSPKAVIYYKFNCPVDLQLFFFDSSLGDDSMIWVFGDGDTSFVRHPIHTYPKDSTYNLEFYCFNKASGCMDSKRLEIKVVDPHPDFSADVTELCSRDTINFTITDDTAGRFSSRWLIESTVTPFNTDRLYRYSFADPGRYTVRLVTWDENDCIDTITKFEYIVFGKPKAGFNPVPFAGCIPHTVTFNDTSTNETGLSSVSYFWDFGDGDTATVTTTSIAHTYSVAGTYTVTEVVTNNIGCKDTITGTVVALRANASYSVSNRNPCIGSVVTYDNTTPGTVSLVWFFGDGSESVSLAPTHSYADTGHYDVSLAVLDVNGCRDTAYREDYIVVGKPVADYAVTDTMSVCVPFFVQFYDSSINAETYKWSFGDSYTSLVPSPTNAYSAPGIYNIVLEVTSIYGCKDTTTGTITVFGYPGSFSYTPDTGCSPLTVHFTAALVNVPYITWDFADGITSTITSTDTISHTYFTPGAYVPKLILSDSAGCTTSNVGSDTIKVSDVFARYSTVPGTVCPGTPFNLADISTSFWTPVTTYLWTYDGITSTVSSPVHTITTPGTYPIHLEVTNGWGCTDIIDTNLVVRDVAPITGTLSVCAGLTTTLSSLTAGGVWSSSNTAVATVSPTPSATMPVTGVAAGTATITYTVLGCFVTTIVTVYATPAAITGTLSWCEGTNSTLTNAAAGGTWSSSSTTVAIGSTSGLAVGLAAGTSVITYQAGTCYATAIATVNAAPAIIGGVTEFCVGSSVVFTNAIAGGVWSSSDTTVATVTAAGVVSGIVPGTAIVSYAIGSCFVTHSFTVSTTIPEIAGLLVICAQATTTLSNATTGGTWSSSNTAIAAINTLSGTLTGMAAGTAIITYSLSGGCTDTATVTILPIPDPGVITGPTKVCIGSTIQLANAVVGGSWSARNTHATIDAAGLLSGISPGTDTVVYTVANALCIARATRVIAVNPLPDSGVITGDDSLCAGATVLLSETVAGGKWSSMNTTVAAIDSVSGAVTTFVAGTTMITYSVTDTNGCSNVATRKLTVIAPSFSIRNTVTNVQCYGDSTGSVALVVVGDPPFAYKWSTGDTTTSIDSLATGTYTVAVTQPATQCTLNDSFVIGQPDSLSIVTDTIPDTCQLARGSITVIVSGGTAPYTYAWSNVPPPANTAATISGIKAGVYQLKVTDANNCIDTLTTPLGEAPCNILEIHDVITPNGDGVNDKWVIEGIEFYPGNTVQLFDKWGDLVYEKQSYNNEWYGQGKSGNLLPDGTYFFVVKLNEKNKTGGNNEFAGTVLIKR